MTSVHSAPVASAVVTTYLELTDASGVRPPSRPPRRPFEIVRERGGAVSRWFYETVGGDWSWTDRAGWSDDEWEAWATAVETWVARVDGEHAGYVELNPQGDDVEIAYFGLLPAFHGLGIGGHLLTYGLERGFELGSRVWVHTCTLDGPHALANYEARGLRAYARSRQ